MSGKGSGGEHKAMVGGGEEKKLIVEQKQITYLKDALTKGFVITKQTGQDRQIRTTLGRTKDTQGLRQHFHQTQPFNLDPKWIN